MRRFIVLAAILAAAVLGGWLFWSGTPDNADAAQSAQASRRPSAVTVTRVKREEIAEEVHVSGTLVAREEVLVTPEVEGLAVTDILVEQGDEVTKGQVLARLSKAALQAEGAQANASIAQARAQIAEAQASVVETKQALQRATTLRKSGTASVQQYDQALASSQASEARLAASKENLKVAEAQKQLIDVRLAHSEIKAPAAGIVSRRTLRLGAIASMVADPAFRIIEDGAIELEAAVIDATLARFSKGQTVRVTPPGITDALTGKIRLISPEVDAVTRLGEVRVELPRDKRLTVGSFASGVVEIGRHNALTLPLSAIAFEDGRNTVQAIVEGRVVTKPVELGLRAPSRVEITSGVSESETIVARAGSFLRDGDEVTPVGAELAEGAQP